MKQNFLAIQNSYDSVQIAVMENNTIAASSTISKMEASKLLMPSILKILSESNLSITDLNFIAVNKGPGPFTTLRVVITTINGIAFAHPVPLVGIDALKAGSDEWSKAGSITAVLYNAFGNDVYCLITKDKKEILYGVFAIEELLQKLKATDEAITFYGNGARLHQNKIAESLRSHALFPKEIPDYCSVEQIAKLGFSKWQQNQFEAEIEPLYLKKHPMQQT